MRNAIKLTRAIEDGSARVTLGGAPAFRWPGGGITLMVDVTRMPNNSFGYVPTPAIVGPIEFTMPRKLYEEFGGHMDRIRPIEDVIEEIEGARLVEWSEQNQAQ